MESSIREGQGNRYGGPGCAPWGLLRGATCKMDAFPGKGGVGCAGACTRTSRRKAKTDGRLSLAPQLPPTSQNKQAF